MPTQNNDEAIKKIIAYVQNEIEVITKDWIIDRPFDGRLGTPQVELQRSVGRMLAYYIPKLIAADHQRWLASILPEKIASNAISDWQRGFDEAIDTIKQNAAKSSGTGGTE